MQFWKVFYFKGPLYRGSTVFVIGIKLTGNTDLDFADDLALLVEEMEPAQEVLLR